MKSMAASNDIRGDQRGQGLRSAATYYFPRRFNLMFFLTVLLLVLTGFGQMPIYNRYYVTSVPGLQWTGDFFTTHLMHYILSALFLAMLGYAASVWFAGLRGTYALTTAAWIRIVLYGGVVLTGIVRVLKNLQDVFVSPETVMAVDFGHLIFVVLLGAAALACKLLGASWLRPRR